ncbi:hypothetical protein AWW72_07950 [Acinetobacter sp. NRRL B-65365]|uniref:glucosyltransferase domain-containing protein n=1 Tax=Acinetobacter sp. NRRL B-65365 TaxID=1785092 RepID=UPI0007A09EED|nr:glucosyltransferase domain-containing protein [Acinetobacter sp. NRRL B-65365]KYQ84573.1 hypothetical protein AWW72_07950 [Acinetobacter sp. NRRL B-65365]
MEILDLIKKYKYHLFVFVNLLWMWALLSPNIYYFDDNYRAAGGYYNWGGDFRPFADWLYYFLGLGRRFTDLTPLPQIFSLFFLYFTYYLYIKRFNSGELNIPTLLVFIPIVWSPFLLSNLYFRYDSIFMLLAILLSVVAVFCVDNRKYIRAIMLVFVTCGLYQPAIVAYVCTALFLVYGIKESENKIDIFKMWFLKSLTYFFIFLIGVLIYYFTIMKFTTDYNWYSTTHSQMSMYNFFKNIVQVVKDVSVVFESDTGFLFLFIFFYLLVINFFYLKKKFSYFSLVVFILIHLGFVVSAAGVNVLLDVPRFEYRTFIFFGFYISYLLLSFFKIMSVDKYRKYSYAILFFVGFYFLSIALNVSNAQKYKNKFDDAIIMDIVSVLYENNFSENQTVVFYGESIPYTVQQLIYKYPIIGGIATNASYYTYKIQNYFPYQLKYIKFRLESDKNEYINYVKKKNDLIVIKDTQFYTIYNSSKDVVIEFKSLESK